MKRFLTAKALQKEARPLTLVINSTLGAIGLRYKSEIFYLNFPKYIKVDTSGIPYETAVDEYNIHLIKTDLHEVVKLIKSARHEAFRYYFSIVIDFFYLKEKK